MTIYHVHLYREMRLSFEGIEAQTPEAAAMVAHGKPTGDADAIEDCEGETLAALVDVAGDEAYDQSRFIDFEAGRMLKATPALLTACRMVVERWERGDLAEAARACDDAVAMAISLCPPWENDDPYSVLLLYPDDANDSGTETFYTFVRAADPLAAVALAQRQAVAALDGVESQPEDFVPLLVTQGHHVSEPLFNK